MSYAAEQKIELQIQKRIRQIVQNIDGNIKTTAQIIAEFSKTDFNPIWLELIRRYLDYGSRHLKYLKNGNQV
jgi:hypothetical protein